jgi:hypothetical protein
MKDPTKFTAIQLFVSLYFYHSMLATVEEEIDRRINDNDSETIKLLHTIEPNKFPLSTPGTDTPKESNDLVTVAYVEELYRKAIIRANEKVITLLPLHQAIMGYPDWDKKDPGGRIRKTPLEIEATLADTDHIWNKYFADILASSTRQYISMLCVAFIEWLKVRLKTSSGVA